MFQFCFGDKLCYDFPALTSFNLSVCDGNQTIGEEGSNTGPGKPLIGSICFSQANIVCWVTRVWLTGRPPAPDSRDHQGDYGRQERSSGSE
ncbi:Mycothiol acetyltransferase [Clarias magur]|uniref:Mycothiol acetyltransferase n=1 Tax=Clarias magur TaxID=1594786 RepID=A0A8J4WVL0_CLAMG|nr:Mycothiol acetyltransferase [Clarias magur]